jgi:ankyrin repeat protein
MGTGMLLITGLALLAIGVAIARLGWTGFTDAGMPFTRSRRLKGRIGEVAGEIVLLMGIGAISSALTSFGTFIFMEHKKAEALSRAHLEQQNGFISEFRSQWEELEEDERLEIAQTVVGQMGKGYTLENILKVPDFATAKACSDEMQRREAKRQQRAFEEQKRQREVALQEQQKQLAENARIVMTGENDLAQLRSRLISTARGTYQRHHTISSIADLCDRMSNALQQTNDKKRAADYCREGFHILQRAIEEEPLNEEYKRRLASYGYSCIGEVGGADDKETILFFEGAVRAARDLANATKDPSDYTHAAGLIHNFTNEKRSSSEQERIEGYSDAIQYERLALIDAPDSALAKKYMGIHISALTRLHADRKNWKAVLDLSQSLQEPSSPSLLLYAAQCCSTACNGARKELEAMAQSGTRGERVAELEAIITNATSAGITHLRQAVAAGLGSDQLDQSLRDLSDLGESPEFQSIISSVKRKQTDSTVLSGNRWDDKRIDQFRIAALRGDLEQIRSLDNDRSPAKALAMALEFAVTGRNSEITQFLLKRGASPNLALLRASREGNVKAVEVLLAAGADPNYFDDLGETPLMVACSADSGPDALRQTTRDFTAVRQLLLKAGARVNDQDTRDFTPLHHAVARNAIDAVKSLVHDDTSPTEIHATVLHLAANNASPEIIKSLLDAGWDPNAYDQEGSTPLHYAAGKGARQSLTGMSRSFASTDAESQQWLDEALKKMETRLVAKISVLINAGADPSLKNKDGKSPIEIAETEGLKSVVDELKKGSPEK